MYRFEHTISSADFQFCSHDPALHSPQRKIDLYVRRLTKIYKFTIFPNTYISIAISCYLECINIVSNCKQQYRLITSTISDGCWQVKELAVALWQSISHWGWSHARPTAQLTANYATSGLLLLRSAHRLPIPRTRTSKYRSFIHYGLIHYQPMLKLIISLFLSNNTYSFSNQNCVFYVVVIAVAVTVFFSHRVHWLFQSTDLLLFTA